SSSVRSEAAAAGISAPARQPGAKPDGHREVRAVRGLLQADQSTPPGVRSGRIALPRVRESARAGRACPLIRPASSARSTSEFGLPLLQLFEGALLIFPSTDFGSRSTARSPSETIPTARPFSTTGILRMAASRMSVTARSTGSSGVSVYSALL